MKRLSHFEEIHVAGQSLTQIGREIRGPLPILYRLAQAAGKPVGRGFLVTAHRWESLDNRGYWYSVTCRSVRETSAWMDAAKRIYPNFRTLAEVAKNQRGGRP